MKPIKTSELNKKQNQRNELKLQISMEILYPYSLIRDMRVLPAKHVIPCSLMIDDQETGCLFITCMEKDLQYYDIHPSTPQEPSMKFRMMWDQKGTHIVDVWMQFENTRILRLFLNPHKSQIKRWLSLGEKTKKLAFVFLNVENQLLATVIIPTDHDESGWFKRNSELALKLKKSNYGYFALSKFIESDVPDNEIVFHHYNTRKGQYFIKEGVKVVSFENP